MKNFGKFIVLEGIDGSGKSTVVDNAKLTDTSILRDNTSTMENKYVFAFMLLVAACGLYWMVDAQDVHDQLSYVQGIADSTSQDLRLIAAQSQAAGEGFPDLPTSCPGADITVPVGLKLNSQGPDVRQLQRFLAWYFQLSGKDRDDLISGNFLTTTQNYLKNFQKDNAMSPTGYVDFGTSFTIRNMLDAQCKPSISSIDPLRPQIGDIVTIKGVNIPTKTPSTIEIWQTNNLCGAGPCSQDFKFQATSQNGRTLTFQIPDGARVTGRHDDRFKVQITTSHGASNEAWVYPFICQYDWNRNVPKPDWCTSATATPTPTPGFETPQPTPTVDNNATVYCWNQYPNHGTKAAANCNNDQRCVYDWNITGGGHCTGR